MIADPEIFDTVVPLREPTRPSPQRFHGSHWRTTRQVSSRLSVEHYHSPGEGGTMVYIGTRGTGTLVIVAVHKTKTRRVFEITAYPRRSHKKDILPVHSLKLGALYVTVSLRGASRELIVSLRRRRH